MIRTRTLTTLILGLSLALAAACGGKDTAEPAEPAPLPGDDTTAESTEPAEPAEPATEPAAEGEVSAELMALMEEAVVLTEKMAEIAETNAGDCDAMASALDTTIDENADLFKRMSEVEDNEAAGEMFDEKYGARLQEAQQRLGPGIGGCMDNENMQATLMKLEQVTAGAE